jgi:hypothetical protein
MVSGFPVVEQGQFLVEEQGQLLCIGTGVVTTLVEQEHGQIEVQGALNWGVRTLGKASVWIWWPFN